MKQSWWQRFKVSAAHTQANIVFSAFIMVATIAYTIIAGVQLFVMKRGAIASSDQTDKLIRAASTQASVAGRNAAAAESFATSAANINRGLSDAVTQLQDQIGRMDAARESSAKASKEALDAILNNAHSDQRAWVGIESAKATGVQRDDRSQNFVLSMTLTLHNYGKSIAQHVRVFPKLDARPWDINNFPCDDSTAKNYSGDVILPTQTEDFNPIVTMSFADMESAIRQENPALGRMLLLRVRGCIEYNDSPTEKTPHHTPFSYDAYRTGPPGYIEADTGPLTADQVRLISNYIQTGQAD